MMDPPSYMSHAVECLQRAHRESSPLTASFWHGKFLQSIPYDILEACKKELGSRGQEENEGSSKEHLLVPCTKRLSSSFDQEVLGEPLLLHVEKAMMSLEVSETSLSPNVFHLITTSVPSHAPSDVAQSSAGSSFLSHDFTLDWTTVMEYLGEEVLSERRDLSVCAEKCGVIAKCVSEKLFKLDVTDVTAKLSQYFSWAHTPSVFQECVCLLWGSNPLKACLSLLLTSAALERALGDVYLTVSSGPSPSQNFLMSSVLFLGTTHYHPHFQAPPQLLVAALDREAGGNLETSRLSIHMFGPSLAPHCPSLLRDLLLTQELEELFGPVAMCLLRCLIGPPSGLNLRNIVWHGFGSVGEIPVEYSCLLLVLVTSLGKTLRSMENLRITYRPYLTFSHEPTLAKVFGELEESDLEEVEQLFSHSYFILPSMRPLWKEAVNAFTQQRYGHCTALLLPVLEHGLRRVFACVNCCPHRVLTAESTTLYTTLDEILSPLLPDGSDNHLEEEIGVPKLEMLLDILEYPEGPRLRDRISHGEVDFQSLSHTLCSYLLCVAALFCVQYSFQDNHTKVSHFRSRCLQAESCYISMFHPVALLRKELVEFISHMEKLNCIPLPDFWSGEGGDDDTAQEQAARSKPDGAGTAPRLPSSLPFKAAMEHVLGCLVQGNSSAASELIPTTDTLLDLFLSSDSSSLLKLVSTVWYRPLRTLCIRRQDSELTGILRRSVENANRAVLQVYDTAVLRYNQYQQKLLRSRQRSNYTRLLSSLRIFWPSLSLLVAVTATAAAQLPLEDKSSTQTIKFHRKVLQFTENFYSQTSSARNRWEEAEKLCYELAASVYQFPYKH